MGLAVFELIAPWIKGDALLAIDDTLARKRGQKMFDCGMHLGFQQPQGWSCKAAERTAPIAMLLYSLVVLWFAREGHRDYQRIDCRWYTSKTEPSFANLLTTPKRRSIRQQVLARAIRGTGARKVRQLLEYTYAKLHNMQKPK